MKITIHNRIAEVVKVINDYAWQLRFIDNGEFVNVFYHNEEEFKYV